MAGLLDLAGSDPSGGLLGSDPTTLGLSLMAAAGPSPVRQPIGSIFGQAGLQAQQTAMRNQMARAQLEQMQQQVAFGRMALGSAFPGQSQPQGAPPATPQGMGAPQTGASPEGAAALGQGAVAQSQGRNPYDPITQQDIAGITVPGVMPLHQQQGLALYMKQDPSKVADVYRNQQIAIAKQVASAPVAKLDTLIRSNNPAAFAQRDPYFMQKWPDAASQLGLDPRDPSAFTDQNVRRALGLVRNQLASSAGIAESEVPETPQEGAYGAQYDQYGKRVTEAKMPTYSVEDAGYDPTTGKNKKQLVITSPGAPPSPGAAGASRAPAAAARSGAPAAAAPNGGLGSVVGSSIDAGYKQPTDQELKSAMFSSEMYSGMKTMQRLEAQGIKLPPSVRTAMLDAAASDNDAVIHQFMSQETLLHKLTPEQQTYMQSLMPVLQAFGHSQAGARVTLGQMRTNMEGIVPIDPANKDDLRQVNANRRGFYVGALSQAGPALQLPQYAPLKSELVKAQKAATAPQVNQQGWKLHQDGAGNLAYVSPDGKQFQELK